MLAYFHIDFDFNRKCLLVQECSSLIFFLIWCFLSTMFDSNQIEYGIFQRDPARLVLYALKTWLRQSSILLQLSVEDHALLYSWITMDKK